MSLGERLRKARKNKNLTQLDVADKIDITNYALSGLERNYRDADEELLRKLADLYEVSYEWLVGKSQNMFGNYDDHSKGDQDIAKFLEALKKEINISSQLSFGREPISEATKESIIECVENMFRQARK